jgi:hypothetical protein
MTLFGIVFKSLRQHLLSTTVTALSLALAVGLLMTVWVVKEQSHATFTKVTGGYDAVLGARGSKLQLVLNAIFQAHFARNRCVRHRRRMAHKRFNPTQAFGQGK